MSLIDKVKRFMAKVSKESSFQLNEKTEEYILDEEVDSVEIEELNEEDNKELENDIELEALDFINNMEILENYLISKSSEIFIDNLMENLIKIEDERIMKSILINLDYYSFDQYNQDEHLLVPVIKDPRKAAGALEWVVQEMANRYNIKQKLPYLIIVIDDLTELIRKEYYKSSIEENLIKIITRGNRVGIFIISGNSLDVKTTDLGKLKGILKAISEEEFNNKLLELKKSEIMHCDKKIDIKEIDDNMTGRDFEIFSEELLKANGFEKIKVTQSSSDYGADVVAYKDDVKYAIQCKKYSSPVGISAIQEVLGSKSMYDCHVAVVMTNNTFTSAAIELAQKNNVLLWDREKMKIMLLNIKDLEK